MSGDFNGSSPSQSRHIGLRFPVFANPTRMGLRHFGQRDVERISVIDVAAMAGAQPLSVTDRCHNQGGDDGKIVHPLIGSLFKSHFPLRTYGAGHTSCEEQIVNNAGDWCHGEHVPQESTGPRQ
jgi:hypothetical protein